MGEMKQTFLEQKIEELERAHAMSESMHLNNYIDLKVMIDEGEYEDALDKLKDLIY